MPSMLRFSKSMPNRRLNHRQRFCAPAMAARVPVLAANVAGLPDLIEEGKTGFFCDPLDAASMRAGIERLLLNSAAARQLANQAKQRALERFHPRVIARRHLEIYREVLS